MKITKRQLKGLINEELRHVLLEQGTSPSDYGTSPSDYGTSPSDYGESELEHDHRRDDSTDWLNLYDRYPECEKLANPQHRHICRDKAYRKEQEDKLEPGGECLTDGHPAVKELKKQLKAAGFTFGHKRAGSSWHGMYDRKYTDLGDPLMILDVGKRALKKAGKGIGRIETIGTSIQRRYPDINFGWVSQGSFGDQILYIYGTTVNDKNQLLLNPWQDLTHVNQRKARKLYGCD